MGVVVEEMTMRTTAFGILTAASLAGLVSFVPGCGGQPGTICSLVCDCEHCNDYEEELTCIQLETSLEVAEAYDCAAEWEALYTCVEEKGKCDEKEANFSTQSEGSCSATQPVGFPCVAQTDCDVIGSGYTCTAGECSQRVCAGANPFPCDTNDDCQGGEDRCGDEQVDLGECEADASGRAQGPVAQP
jgi:hypothetical protein